MNNQDNEKIENEIGISVDKKTLKQFILDKKWLLLLLIPLILTIVVRLQPMRLIPMEKSAESSVINYYHSQLRAQIDKQFPNLPEDQRNKITDEKFSEFLKTVDKNILNNQIKQNADALKSRLQYESGRKTYVYLGDIDSYYWLRMGRNILEKGTQCDIVQNNICYDSYTLAPTLRAKAIDYYPIMIVGIYKILRIFDRDISLMQASFLTPLVFSLFLTIPLFLLLRRIGGNISAVVGTILVNVNPHVLSRSLGSDNDIVNVFFQALFLWLVIECFYAKSSRAKYIWSFLSGASLSIYSRFWSGWWYLVDLFIFSLAFSAFFIILHNWYSTRRLQINELKKPFIEISFIAFFFLIAIILFYGMMFASLSDLFSVLKGQFGVLKFKVASNINLWPNVLTTVAEFHSMSLPQIVSTFGSVFRIPIFLMTILGCIFLIFPTTRFINKNLLLFFILVAFDFLLYSFLKSSQNSLFVFLLLVPVFVGLYTHLKVKEEAEFHPDVVFLLTVLICLVVYFSTMGARFFFLMVIPVSIFASLFLSRASILILSTLRKLINMPKIIFYSAITLLVSWFLIAPIQAGFGTAQNYMPTVTDEWVTTLEKIKQESKPDAIINSWWDFGHWFKYFADRRVTLDGSSQNSPQLHWLGKLLLTSDENMSRGILRMLDCGGNKAFYAINEKLNDTPHSIDVLNEIIIQRKQKAKEILTIHNFTDKEVENILNYTHCKPPEDFLITSEDMIGKSGVWAHFGSWDFKKSYLSAVVSIMAEKDIIKKFKEDYNIPNDTTKKWIEELRSLNSQDAINAWIAPWPGYISSLNSCGNQGNISLCQFSHGDNQFPVFIDFENKEAYIIKPDGAKLYPQEVAFVKENSFDLIRNSKDTISFGVAAIESGDSVSAMFMSPEITGSIFTRLFFFDGIGLNSFEKFYDTTNVYRERIITWKVVWDKLDE